MMDAKAQRREELESLSHRVIGCAIRVHRELGPGLLENIYEACLVLELIAHGIDFRRQVPVRVNYCGRELDLVYRIDLLVHDRLVVELKSTTENQRLHRAQLLTYLNLTGCRLGLLLNFGHASMAEGVRRVVNGLDEKLRVFASSRPNKNKNDRRM